MRVHLISLSLVISLIASATALNVPTSKWANDATFAIPVAKGRSLYERLDSGCEPDVLKPIDFEALKAIGFRIGEDEKSHWPLIFQENSAFANSQVVRFK